MENKNNIKDTYNIQYMSCSSDEEDVDEHKVQNISYKQFYKSHRIIAFIILIIYILINIYLYSNLLILNDRIYRGVCCVCGIFIIISLLIYPNGPFVRPHPIIWRAILAIGVIYTLFMTFLLFLSYQDVRNILIYLDSNLKEDFRDLRNYASDCRFVWEAIKPQLDIFCIYHFSGWFAKSLVLRHSGILWFFSIMWELSELFFQHLLPNFKECWWDIVFLDILLCNGFGIYFGSLFLKSLQYRRYHWESVKMIKSKSAKIKRILLQFSPITVDSTNWFSTTSIWPRVLQLTILCIVCQTTELNLFLLKHIYLIDSRHPYCALRSVLIGLLGLPACRQYYEYCTNPRIRTVGIYPWIFFLLTISELLLCCIHGSTFFYLKVWYLIPWFIIQLFASFIVISLGILYKNFYKVKQN